MSLLQIATPAQTTKAIEDEGREDVPEKSVQFLSGLAAHIQNTFEEAERVKNIEITPRLLTCQRLRRGVYSPQELASIQEQGGSDVFINLTNVKCRAAESWIKDIMLSQGNDKPWTLEPSPIPDLPDSLEVQIMQAVAQEQANALSAGMEVHPGTFEEREREMREELKQKLHEVAEARVKNMESKIEDQLAEGGFLSNFKAFINDFTTFPSSFIKGPVIRKERRLTWGPDGKPAVESVLVRKFVRVSPFDIYPSPDAADLNDGPLCERHRLFVQTLEAMKGVEGYKDDEIDKVIERYGVSGFRENRAYDMQRDELEARPSTAVAHSSTIDAIQFWGSVLGKELKEWAGGEAKKMSFDALKDAQSYEIEAWLVGGHVIKAMLNPDPMGKRSYDKASWDEVPGSFWGKALPELMDDMQRMINACGRSLSNNMGISSGPQVEVNVDRLPDGATGIESMYPWKIWPTKSDRTGGGQAAVRFFQPASNAAELRETMDWFYRKADEVTGIPNYVYGSAQASGAGRTASGLSMLMENASKGIRQAIGNVDEALSSLITRMYNHNMLYEQDDSIKGDCNVVAKGAMGLIAREAIQSRRNDFLAVTSNPVDTQILGPKGRAYLLREMAKGLQLDVNKVVPSEAQLNMQEQAAAQQQQLVQQQQQADIAATHAQAAPTV